MTILELLKEDGITAKKTSPSSSDEKYESPCPACKGDNRFQIWINNGNDENFWCRQCEKGGGIIQYLMYFRGMTYDAACQYSGKAPGIRKSIKQRILRGNNHRLVSRDMSSPSTEWQQQSKGFLKWSIETLWGERYIIFRNWLTNDRGLTEETVREANLGWLPTDWYSDRKDWGLPEKLKEDGTPSQLWLPAGLVIPCFHNGQLQRLKIRRPDITEGNRYHFIPGSSPIPMVLGAGDIFIIVESELDAILLRQEAGDLVGIIAMGSAQMKPDQDLSIMLHQAKRILVSLDSDETGIKNSWKSWLANYPNAIRLPVIKGKDPTEAYLKGLNLRDWVKVGIKYQRQQLASIANPSPAMVEKVEMAPIEVSPDPRSTLGQLEQLKTSPILAIRIVTAGDNPFKDEITAIAVGAPDHTPVLLELTQSQPEEMVNSLKQLLGTPSEKVLYDAKTALNFLHVVGIKVNGPIHDVMLADKILTAGIGKKDVTFKDVISEYSNTIEEGDLDNISIADEAAILLELREVTLSHLTDNNLMDTAALEFECVRAVAGMERNGIRVDKKKLTEMLQVFTDRKDILEPAVKKEMGDINLNSFKQVMEALIAKGIRVKNTQQETLQLLVSNHPFLSGFLSLKEVTHDISVINNLLSRINATTGRLHPQYSQIGAPTGRFSCSNPNLQAIPAKQDFRSCFIPDNGHKLLIADYSQIELRIAAEISKDSRMIAAYQNGEDLHKLTASLVTGKSIADITKDERSAAKAVNFGLIYAMGASTLKEYAFNTYGVALTLEQALEFRRKFFSAYQGIAQWHQDVQRGMARETRTLGNRRRQWGEGQAKITELLNSPVQGTSADITKKALSILHKRAQGNEIKIVGCIHDEIIVEVPVSEAASSSQILEESMVDAGKIYLKNVPVLVEVSVANNWYEK